MSSTIGKIIFSNSNAFTILPIPVANPTHGVDGPSNCSTKPLYLPPPPNTLLEPNPSWRYNASQAIKHPWITRNKNDEVPLTFNEILHKNNMKKIGRDLFGAINNGSVDAIVVPKTIYLENIISNSKINISYNITDMKKYFVLRLGSNKDLNKILSKYYEKWSKDNFENSFNHNLSECYFSFKQIYEQDKAAFRSKQYKYAFVDNAPYDSIVNGELKGINNELIKSFANVADIEISYKKYKNYEDLLKDFNSNNIDFYFNTSSISKYSMDVSNTVSAYNARAAVLVHNKNNAVITSEYSLNKYDVVTIKNSKIDKYLDSIKVNTINYNNIKEIAKKKKKNNIIVIDNDTYNTYRNTKFKDFINVYQFDINSDYYFTGRDINNNKIFNSFFSFYISYMDTNLLSSNINNNIFNIKKNNYLIFIVIFMLLLIGACISVFVFLTH